MTAYASELKILFAGKAKTNSDLFGKWKCAWFVKQEAGEEKEIDDLVEITKVWGEGTSGSRN